MRENQCLLGLLALVLVGCPKDELGELESRKEAPLPREQVPVATPEDLPQLDAAEYRRTLVEQLDLVPAGADYLVIRDLRPLVGEARTIERVMAGPLARALPGVIGLADPGEVEATSAELESARSTLALLLAGLESSGVALDQGLVLSELAGEPLLVFGADDLGQLATIAGLLDPSLELAKRCAPVEAATPAPSWWACSVGGSIADYRPGRAGARLEAELAGRLPGVELSRVNLAITMKASEAAAPLSLALRSDPGLWELSLPLPLGEQASLLASGPAPALRSLAAGAPFVWARWDPTQAKPPAPGVALPLDLLTGELMLGPIVAPEAMVLRVGITDASEAAKLVQKLGGMVPSKPVELESLPGTTIEVDRAPVDLDGVLIPALGLSASGGSTPALEQTLGLPARARAWAYGEYFSVGYGEIAELPAMLEAQSGAGPSPALVASLPITLGRALLASEVGALLHLVLDPWQAPLREAELAELLAGVPEAARPSATSLEQVFAALAPWSSVSVWVRQAKGAAPWIVHVSVVPFAAPGPGIGPEEQAASEAALALALAGGDAASAYRALLDQYPSSPRAASWRARLGEAPDSFEAVGLVELGLLGYLAVPMLSGAIERSKASEASDETAAILAAALAQRERLGECTSLLGVAGPTPALSVACSGRCRPGDPGYSESAWTEDPRWAALGWAPKQGHRFHYAFEATVAADECTLSARAYGDLDADGIFSTYTRSTTIAADGSQRSPGLQIEKEGE